MFFRGFNDIGDICMINSILREHKHHQILSSEKHHQSLSSDKRVGYNVEWLYVVAVKWQSIQYQLVACYMFMSLYCILLLSS